MELNPIEEPRVFISYSWDSEEYKARVASFAEQLMADGIDVILDQWSVIEGNDLNAFMERSVTDKSVTNVLMMLSPRYAEKADKRAGGVGAEAQVISAQVYSKTEQTKFIPVIFGRDESGKCPPPAYLSSLMYYDLASPDTYDESYRRLVKRLYGRVAYEKPKLGHKPAFVDDDSPAAPVADLLRLDTLKGNQPDMVKRRTFGGALETAADALIDWHANNCGSGMTESQYLEEYGRTLVIRDAFLRTAEFYPYVNGGARLLGEALENVRRRLESTGGNCRSIKLAVAYELFLSVVGSMLKLGDYGSVGLILGRFYPINDVYNRPGGYTAFWHEDHVLESAVCKRDNRRYISGLAELIVERADPKLCPKEWLIVADGVCFNYALMSDDIELELRWTPRLYHYDHYAGAMKRFALKMRSRELLPGIAALFGCEDVNAFRTKYGNYEAQIDEGKHQGWLSYAHQQQPVFLPRLVKTDELGTRP